MMNNIYNNIDQYKNLISLLNLAVSFYADSENYKKNNKLFSPVEMDGGSQARFTLQQVQETLDANQKMEEDYTLAMTAAMSEVYDDSMFNIKKEIEALKNIGNDGND